MDKETVQKILNTLNEEIKKFEEEIKKGGYPRDFCSGWLMAMKSTRTYLTGLLCY